MGFVAQKAVSAPRELQFYKTCKDMIAKIACGADFTIILTESGQCFAFGRFVYLLQVISNTLATPLVNWDWTIWKPARQQRLLLLH